MMYYRAKGEYLDYFTGWSTVLNEFITPKERNTKFRYLSDDCFQKVECSKYDTFFFFGARFPMHDAEVVEL